MSLERSPSLDLYRKGLPPQLPDPRAGRRRTWMAIVALACVALALGAGLALRSGAVALLMGTGTISGLVVDREGRPVQAEIFVERSSVAAFTDAAGRFTLDGVPAGRQLIVVARDGVGWEHEVVVHSGAIVQLGPLRTEVTAVAMP